MSPPHPTSNIRAFVQWREPSVYAGEEIECIITFKNIASVRERERENVGPQSQSLQGKSLSTERRTSHAPSPVPSRRSSLAYNKSQISKGQSAPGPKVAAPQVSGHRPALSLNIVGGEPNTLQSAVKTPKSTVRGHGRSLSIISLGSEPTSEGRTANVGPAAKRPTQRHGRSASLQFLPKQPPQVSPKLTAMSPRQPSPLYESSTPPIMSQEPLPIRPARRRQGVHSADNTPQLARQTSLRKAAVVSSPMNGSFQFPETRRQGTNKSPSVQQDSPNIARTPSALRSGGEMRAVSPRPPNDFIGGLNSLNPVSWVMSESSTTGTPRTSSEFYSTSNRSDETLTSEMPSNYQMNGRIQPNPPQVHSASQSRTSNAPKSSAPEILMMGYAQTMGRFVLDGGLVNAAPFEEVKRKGVQGDGGVIGVERSKRGSGMFGAFSWGNIGESLGGLLGGDDMSSIAQMKATASSKSIPLLSTPQNLLFVNLRLAPGESRSYSYRFRLPRGLPPSHRGRAIKISYHLAVGVQRPEGQAVKHVEIPFRVLGSYDGRGDALGHDLMSPYIMLQDAASSESIDPHNAMSADGFPTFLPKESSRTQSSSKQNFEDFLRYTERLLDGPKDTGAALASPTSSISRKGSLADPIPPSVKETVDLAILRANYISETENQNRGVAQSANRFNIARSGQPIAILTLLRPAYKLGEAVTGTIDFSTPTIDSDTPVQCPTYSLIAELESAERVDGSLSLRSAGSIHRVTRKAHAAVRANTLFSRRISFALSIPPTATPSFETTGVSLVWRLRIEFTTARRVQGLGVEGHAQSDDMELLEELSSDERGVTLIAKERLPAETFEIALPLKVYGVPSIERLNGDRDALEV